MISIARLSGSFRFSQGMERSWPARLEKHEEWHGNIRRPELSQALWRRLRAV
jgi:hypothetical protein